ncbi:MAG: hypothetical protein KHY83_02890 [Coriobacteriia bacterium]|nr:hypothetical protein [Coriobacteriia bacterium]MBS5477595.1 hypothetical protein [Coriobacteriia bacterium]
MAKKQGKSRPGKASKRGSVAALGAHPELDFRSVVAYFAQRSGELDGAYGRFLSEVDPSSAAQNDAGAQHRLARAFAEWFVFDYHLANDRTPLEHFVVCAPAKTDRAVVELFRQVAATQFFSLFWVRSIDAAAKTVTLEDLCGGATYAVYDARLSSSLRAPGGLVALRLAQAAGEWRCPWEAALYREGLEEGRFGDAVARLAEMGRRVDLIDILHLTFGSAGDGAPADPARTTADAGSPGIDVPPEQRAAYLARCQESYEQLARAHGLTVGWGDIVRAIRTCPGDRVAHDVVEQLFGADASALGHVDDDTFAQLMGAFLGAWNLVPHNYLDGKSPAEVYQGR